MAIRVEGVYSFTLDAFIFWYAPSMSKVAYREAFVALDGSELPSYLNYTPSDIFN